MSPAVTWNPQRLTQADAQPQAVPDHILLPGRTLAVLRERRARLVREARYQGPGDTLEAVAYRTGALDEIERLLASAEPQGDPTA